MRELSLDAKIEAVLFLLGEPVKIDFLAKILEVDKNEISEAILSLEKNLENRGICLIQKDEKIMLATSPDAADITKKIIKEKNEEELTKSMLEVLAIVLYKGPLSKIEIDYVRGVNSVFTLRNLLVRGLVERAAIKNSGGFIYRPTFQLLQFLGVKSLEELPEKDYFAQKINEFLVRDKQI